MTKRNLLPLSLYAFALGMAFSLHSARAADDYVEKEPVEKSHVVLAGGCIDVWATTSQVDAVRYGDPIPVRLVWVLKPTSTCQTKQDDVKLLPPSAPPPQPSAAASAQAKTADVAPVLMPTPLDVPEINLQTIKSGKLTVDPSDVETLSVGATGEDYLDPKCGPKCGKIVVQDIVVTQHITMQTIPPKSDNPYSTPKPDDKTPPKYKRRASIVMDFDYATYLQPGDNQPAWKTEHTPALVVAIHQSAGISETDPSASESLLREGDRSAKVSPLAPAVIWLGLLAVVFALPMVAYIVRIVVLLITRERVLSVNERVWGVIDAAMKEIDEAGASRRWQIEQYRRIFFELRKHFKVLGPDTTQILDTLSKRPGLDTAAVSYVFNRETVFFDDSKTVSAEERAEFLRNIEVLIPRR